MRLFHASEEKEIEVFEPRVPKCRQYGTEPIVWAVEESRLPNFLTPRNCPRVAYYKGENTTEEDIARFFSTPTSSYVLVMEGLWYKTIRKTAVYTYEFDPADFTLSDVRAGYYVSGKAQHPIGVTKYSDLLGELVGRGVEVRFVDDLWAVAEQVKASTLDWSLIRMGYAQRIQT